MSRISKIPNIYRRCRISYEKKRRRLLYISVDLLHTSSCSWQASDSTATHPAAPNPPVLPQFLPLISDERRLFELRQTLRFSFLGRFVCSFSVWFLSLPISLMKRIRLEIRRHSSGDSFGKETEEADISECVRPPYVGWTKKRRCSKKSRSTLWLKVAPTFPCSIIFVVLGEESFN